MRFESRAGRQETPGQERNRFRRPGHGSGGGNTGESNRLGPKEIRQESPFPNFYGHLGIQKPKEATQDDIRIRFKALAQHYGSPEYLQTTPRERAITQLERVIVAYRVLRDPTERQRYDQERIQREQSAPENVERRLAELTQEVERENGLGEGTLGRSVSPSGPGEGTTPSGHQSSGQTRSPSEVDAAMRRLEAEVSEDQKHGRGAFGGVIPVDGTGSEMQPHEKEILARKRERDEQALQADRQRARRAIEARDKDLQQALNRLRELKGRSGQ